MKTEQKVLAFSAFINFIVALIKIIGGNILGFATLIADGFYTISDLITDILALVGSKISHKRANKRYPLGYGNFEFIIQMIIGFIILFVGLFIIFISFRINLKTPNFFVILILLLVITLKLYSSRILLTVGKNINSSILINSSKESFIDVLSSLIIIPIVIIGQFFKEIDKIGSIIIGLMIIYQAFKIIYQNGVLLIGKAINNESIANEIQKVLARYPKIIYKKSLLIKHGSYYHLILDISVAKSYTIRDLLQIEASISKSIKKRKLGIKIIDFDIDIIKK